MTWRMRRTLTGAIKTTMLMFGPFGGEDGDGGDRSQYARWNNSDPLAERFELDGMLDSGMRVAIDGTVEPNTSPGLHDSAEVAFLPPVSGG